MMGLTVEQLFEKKNVQAAMDFLKSKADTSGIDGMKLSELPEYWNLNADHIYEATLKGSYEPAIVKEVEIVTGNGKRRVISKICSVDRLILRCLLQKLRPKIEPTFSDYSFAYQEGKGALGAAKKVVEYLDEGYGWCAEMDIRNFFDSISQNRVLALIHPYIGENCLFLLLERYLRCRVERDCRIKVKESGILQGSPLSPLFSNLYLDGLDRQLETEGVRFCRFADNINIYTKTIEESEFYLERMEKVLNSEYELQLNKEKSGVFYGARRKYLGFCFEETAGHKYIARRFRKAYKYYNHWHSSAVQRIDRNYHIVNDGIINLLSIQHKNPYLY